MLDEQEFEWHAVIEEREASFKSPEGSLGETLNVSASPTQIVATILRRGFP